MPSEGISHTINAPETHHYPLKPLSDPQGPHDAPKARTPTCDTYKAPMTPKALPCQPHATCKATPKQPLSSPMTPQEIPMTTPRPQAQDTLIPQGPYWHPEGTPLPPCHLRDMSNAPPRYPQVPHPIFKGTSSPHATSKASP